MSQVRVYTLLGDSNVSRNLNKASFRANPSMKSAQMLQCGHLTIFKETLSKARNESNVCIVACLTNFLCHADGPDVVSQRIDPVLAEVREVLDAACSDNPDRFFIISPPMYRMSPTWYRDGLPEVLTTFSQAFAQERPANLLMMPSFATPAFQADGVHLTPFSGLEYLMHLFDSSEDLLVALASSPAAATSRNTEVSRVLEDRMMALEQDHRRLNKVVEDKIAIDAEASDAIVNEKWSDFFVLVGLSRIDPDLVGKAWQDQAMKDVQAFITLLMGKALDIVYVKNATARHKDAEVAYNVQMRSVADSKAIRDKFGEFFVGGDKRPDNMKPYAVRNRVTPETKVRLAVLQVQGRRYKTSNPGAKVQVIGYDHRPMIKITPASDASDRRVLSYNFVEAVKALPTTFNSTELDFILKKVNPKLCGRLRSLFIILSDDLFRKRLLNNKTKPTRPQGTPEDQMEQDQVAPAEGDSSRVSSGGESSSLSKSKSSKSRSQKRGATASPGDSAPAKK